jgi:hypothetical protein
VDFNPSQDMGRKRHRTGDDDHRIWKRVQRGQTGVSNVMNRAHTWTPERHNRPVVDQGLIYTDRLGAGMARILILHAGSGLDEIKCDLKFEGDIVHSEVPQYEALSYVWGKEENPCFIILCRYRFAVTRNLAEALQHLRNPYHERMLWVDAICINQYDDEEKAAQVRSMHWIYESAKEVIAWLGPPDASSNLAYSTMNMIQDHLEVLSAPIAVGFSRDGTIEDPFRNFMTREYWSRAWVVQEMMCARSLVLQCGSEVVPYSKLEKASEGCAHFQVTQDTGGPTPINFRGEREIKIPRMNSPKMCPNHFLDCYLDRECRDRHDNIFAFLNLLSGNIGRKIRVCYKTDIRKLIRITARAIMKSTNSSL